MDMVSVRAMEFHRWIVTMVVVFKVKWNKLLVLNKSQNLKTLPIECMMHSTWNKWIFCKRCLRWGSWLLTRCNGCKVFNFICTWICPAWWWSLWGWRIVSFIKTYLNFILELNLNFCENKSYHCMVPIVVVKEAFVAELI